MVSGKDNKLTLVGYGGHAHVVAETADILGTPPKYYVNKEKVIFNPFDLRYLGDEWSDEFNRWEECSFILGIGENVARMKVAHFIRNKGSDIKSIEHPNSSISKKSELEDGVFVSRNVSVNTYAHIGSYSILNTGCTIEHDCIIGESCHVAPGATLCGNVSIGKCSFIGANSVIKEGLNVGENVIIGAGAVVLKNIPNGAKVVGNPGRII